MHGLHKPNTLVLMPGNDRVTVRSGMGIPYSTTLEEITLGTSDYRIEIRQYDNGGFSIEVNPRKIIGRSHLVS